MSEKEREKGPLKGPVDYPPCLIVVDAEGRMWHQGAEMTHEGINNLLRENVSLDDYGNYIIELGGQKCYAEVADTFFVITRVEAVANDGGRPEKYIVTLNDGGTEELVLSTLYQNGENIMYARVKDGKFPARFLRRSYYQLAAFVREKDGRYLLPAGGEDIILA